MFRESLKYMVERSCVLMTTLFIGVSYRPMRNQSAKARFCDFPDLMYLSRNSFALESSMTFAAAFHACRASPAFGVRYRWIRPLTSDFVSEGNSCWIVGSTMW